MRISQWPIALIILYVSAAADALSTPRSRASASTPRGLTIPLIKRAPRTLAVDDDGAWAAELGRRLYSKYNPDALLSKRATGFNLLTNQVRIPGVADYPPSLPELPTDYPATLSALGLGHFVLWLSGDRDTPGLI